MRELVKEIGAVKRSENIKSFFKNCWDWIFRIAGANEIKKWKKEAESKITAGRENMSLYETVLEDRSL